MDQDFWVREIGRLFKRSSDDIQTENTESVEIFVEDFNEALSRLQKQYGDNPIIQSTNPIDPTEQKTLGGIVTGSTRKSSGSREPAISTYEGVRKEALYEVRSNSERIANSLGYELPTNTNGSSTDQMIIVQMENTQSANQEMSSDISIETVMKLIEHDPEAQTNQQELENIVEKFDEELESNDPNAETLRQFIRDAKEYSVSVAAKLAMLALQAGVIGVLGFQLA
jgi:uncharacterized FlaG/YvyC family protein